MLLVRARFNKDQLIQVGPSPAEVTEAGKDQARVQQTDIRNLAEVNSRAVLEELMEQAAVDRFITKKDLITTRAIVDVIPEPVPMTIPVLRQRKDLHLKDLHLKDLHLKDLHLKDQANASMSGLIRTTDGSAKTLPL